MKPTFLHRRHACALLLSLAPALALAGAQAAFPKEPIKLIVPFPPAGGTDVVSRMISERIAAQAGWAFVVDNRAGAGGNIGLDLVAKARADGHTIGMGQTSNLAINPSLYAKMPFDPLKDLVPIALVASQPVVLVVRAESPYRTLAELVAAARAKPGTLTMASAGNGTVGHLAGEMFAKKAGLKFMHVPYKGAGPALTDLLGGQTDLFFITPPGGIPQIRSGKLRALAVSSAKRVPVLPDAPTIAESGYPGFEANDWKGLVAPAGTPPEVVQRINAEVDRALAKPNTIARLLAEGSAPMGGSAQQMEKFLKAEHARWGAAVKDAQVKLD
jgi:tripartite-type tricarboxylate transporter receptor subunit TctC